MQEGLVGRHAQRDGVLQAGHQLASRGVARFAMADDLGDHRVVERRNPGAGAHRVLHAQLRRHVPQRHGAALRHEALVGVFGAQAHLDGMPAETHLVLRDGQRLAGRHAQLQRDQVEPGHGFGHRVLHLQPGVHLHEVEAALGVEQELQRAGALVADRLDRGHCRGAHARAQRGVDGRRGRFLDQLLVAALHRAVAFPEVDHVAVPVGEDLDLDVARRRDGALEDELGVPEGALCLRAGAAQQLGELPRRRHQPHAAPATACGGLDHHREADARGLGREALFALIVALVARDAGHAGGLHERLGAGLVAHRGDGLGGRADEDQPRVVAGLREVLVLGQEAVARVHGVRAAEPGRLDDGVDAQVRLRRQRLADAHRLVGLAHVARCRVGAGIHRHGPVAQRARGPDDAQRDLAAVGDQDLSKGRGPCGRCGHEAFVGGAFSAWTERCP